MAGTGMYEEARRFLREPQEAVRELAIRMEQLRRWRELSDRVTSVLGTVRVQGQPQGNRVESCACEAAELEEEIDRTRERIHTLRRRQESVLSRVGDARLSELLRLYYQCSFTWAETADHMGYSERQIMRLHRLALERVQKILQDDRECHLAS